MILTPEELDDALTNARNGFYPSGRLEEFPLAKVKSSHEALRTDRDHFKVESERRLGLLRACFKQCGTWADVMTQDEFNATRAELAAQEAADDEA